ncbi:hypothetical protein [Rufibacter latericius]|uniref:Uncharacterized protein n=1 Tax=Rufibacter latericius TaxID=2487040 RepID=A0A3M9MBS6_9BACT|nr:hypothetical protein [Rufibacter latericius]RNI22038.1 hypothetical protein EFB08_23180 [Rufibacter latericius]
MRLEIETGIWADEAQPLSGQPEAAALVLACELVKGYEPVNRLNMKARAIQVGEYIVTGNIETDTLTISEDGT